MPMMLDPNAMFRSSFVGARPLSGLDLMMMQAADDRRMQSNDLRLAVRDRRLKENALAEEARQADMVNQRFYDQLGHDAAKTSYLTDAEFAQKRMGYGFQWDQAGREAGWQADRDARLAGFQAERDAKYQGFLMEQDENQQAARLGEIEYRRDLEAEEVVEARREQLKQQGYDYTPVDQARLDKLNNERARLDAAYSSGELREKSYRAAVAANRKQTNGIMPTQRVKTPQQVQKEQWDSFIKLADGRIIAPNGRGGYSQFTPPKEGGAGLVGASGGSGSFFQSEKGKQHLFDKAFELHKEQGIPMPEAVQRIREGAAAFDREMGQEAGGAPLGPQVPPQIEADMRFIRGVNQVLQNGGSIQNEESIRALPAAEERVRQWMSQWQAAQSQRAGQGGMPPAPMGGAPAGGMIPRGPAKMAPGPGGEMPPQAVADPFAQGPVGPQAMVGMPSDRRSMAEAAVRALRGMKQGDVVKVIPKTPAAEMAIRMLQEQQGRSGYEGGRVITPQQQQAPVGQPMQAQRQAPVADDYDAQVMQVRQRLAADATDPQAAMQALKLQSVSGVASLFTANKAWVDWAKRQPQPMSREQFEAHPQFESMLEHARKRAGQPVLREELYQGYLAAVQQAGAGERPEEIPGEMTEDDTKRLRGQLGMDRPAGREQWDAKRIQEEQTRSAPALSKSLRDTPLARQLLEEEARKREAERRGAFRQKSMGVDVPVFGGW